MTTYHMRFVVRGGQAYVHIADLAKFTERAAVDPTPSQVTILERLTAALQGMEQEAIEQVVAARANTRWAVAALPYEHEEPQHGR